MIMVEASIVCETSLEQMDLSNMTNKIVEKYLHYNKTPTLIWISRTS